MNMIKRTKTSILLFLLTTFWCYGYIDPGTGSFLVQVIIALFVGASLGIKIFWKNIKNFVVKLFSKEKKAG
jgi:hypothetical protein